MNMDVYDDEEDDEQSMMYDLQLAAELGKTLLERNKELETSLKQHQNVIEDQTQEIEYLTKQTAALREVNDSRLRIYEQLEVSIQDLERANQRLSLDNSADKKHIKSLCASIDTLEARCEELQRGLDEASLQQDSYRRRQQRLSVCSTPGTPTSTVNAIGVACTAEDEAKELADDEEVIGLLTQLQELRSQKTKEQRKASELEEQLANVLQDNLSLEEQLTVLRQKEEDMKSLQEEMSTLEEVRQGHICGRCLRHVDSRNQDELSLLMDHEEEDDVSVVNSIVSETHRSTAMIQIEGTEINQPYDNPYRILVEKYEALVQMQRPSDTKRHSMVNSISQTNCLSLQEELQMSGDFNSFNAKDIEEQDEDAVVPEKELSNKMVERGRGPAAKTFSMTPTDFSEAETSSSGFSDETSNKGTQTEIIAPAGSFLCSIADGNDCRFSIYDDANPVESRFRKKPQYRQLFREIFDVLKRAAENKDEGEQLPLLDDITPVTDAPKVPPATPAREDVPSSFSKDTTPTPDRVAANSSDKPLSLPNGINALASTESIKSDKQVPITPALETEASKTTHPPAPKQDILEYLSIGVGIKKKSNGRKNSPMKTLKTSVAERVENLEARPSTGNKAGSGNGRRRRHMDRVNDSPSSSRPESPGTFGVWYNKEATAPSEPPSTSSLQQQQPNWDFKPYLSSASQEVAKLKRLEKSYAEVLRLGPQPSHRPKTINGYRRH